jgi:hypothetical protein
MIYVCSSIHSNEVYIYLLQVSNLAMFRIAFPTFSALKVAACPSVPLISVHLTPKDYSFIRWVWHLMVTYFAHSDVLDVNIYLWPLQIDQIRDECWNRIGGVHVPHSIRMNVICGVQSADNSPSQSRYSIWWLEWDILTVYNSPLCIRPFHGHFYSLLTVYKDKRRSSTRSTHKVRSSHGERMNELFLQLRRAVLDRE